MPLTLMQEYLIKEAQVMREQRHPNVLPLYCSFVAKNQLWMVMPFVGAGSLLAVLQSSFPDVGSGLLWGAGM